jgi:phytoene dehydrogenase-like protein
MADSFDAVLIGAGHNTLAAALHLAAKGWKVGIFEQAATAGGAVKTGEYTLPGFRHDWAAMNLSLFAGSLFFKAYGAELARHGCEFVPVDRPFSSSFPDAAWVGVSTVGTETQDAFRALSPADAQTFQDLTSRFGTEAPHLFGLLGSEMKIRALAYFMFKTLRAKGLAGTLDMGRFLLSSPRAWLEETFQHPPTSARCSGPGGCTSTSRPTSRVGRCSPTSKAWRARPLAWSSARAARIPSSRR